LISQREGANPFEPLNQTVMQFTEPRVTMVAGSNFTTGVTWFNETMKSCFYNAWLQAGAQRIKLHTEMIDNNQTLVLDYVPSVFMDNLTFENASIQLVMESLIFNDKCRGFSAAVNVSYINNLTQGVMKFANEYGVEYSSYIGDEGLTVFRIPIKDWLDINQTFTITWTQNLTTLMDDGYSNSACLSLVTADTKQIIRRMFARNLGQQQDYNVYLEGSGTPTNRLYRFQLSPTSAKRENFKTIEVILDVVADGENAEYRNPYRATWRKVLVVVLMLFTIIYMAVPMYFLLIKKKKAKGEELEVPLQNSAVRQG
jgi:hypothetical protein